MEDAELAEVAKAVQSVHLQNYSIHIANDHDQKRVDILATPASPELGYAVTAVGSKSQTWQSVVDDAVRQYKKRYESN